MLPAVLLLAVSPAWEPDVAMDYEAVGIDLLAPVSGGGPLTPAWAVLRSEGAAGAFSGVLDGRIAQTGSRGGASLAGGWGITRSRAHLAVGPAIHGHWTPDGTVALGPWTTLRLFATTGETSHPQGILDDFRNSELSIEGRVLWWLDGSGPRVVHRLGWTFGSDFLRTGLTVERPPTPADDRLLVGLRVEVRPTPGVR